ncbi:MAG: permease [Polyangiales bacterium]
MDSKDLLMMAAVLGLLLGPLLYSSWPRGQHWRRGLDAFCLSAVTALALALLLPQALAHAQVPALVGGALGLFVPRLLEGVLPKAAVAGRFLPLMIGLTLHALVESAALAVCPALHVRTLGTAIVVHRLPIGLLIFAGLTRHHGARRGWLAIVVLVVVTVAGFVLGQQGGAGWSPAWVSGLEAFVAASLLHVGMHPHEGGARQRSTQAAAAAGALAALALLYWATLYPVHSGPQAEPLAMWQSLRHLALTSAPALLIAYVLAGLLHVYASSAGLAWLSRGGAPGQALRGVLFGLPLPFCSCGVLPVYESLSRRGVAPVAALAFLVATPELGLDAVLLSVPLLGLPLTLVRCAAAALVALGVAMLVGRDMAPVTESTTSSTHHHHHHDHDHHHRQPCTEQSRLRQALQFGLVDLFDHTMPWVLLGLILAAVAEPLLDPAWLQILPSVLQVPLLTLIGVPFYVCASGATPIAAVLIAKGVSPGAALAFLLAGPASNLTTFGILKRLHGHKRALTFALSMALGAMLLGWSIDALSTFIPLATHVAVAPHTPHAAPIWQWLCLWLLAGLLAASLWRQGLRGLLHHIVSPTPAHG